MVINFYTNNSQKNKIGKNLTLLGQVTGVPRQPCDFMNPSILIQGNNYLTSNYAYIDTFGKYYFVSKPPTSQSKDLWLWEFEEDVAESVKSGLLQKKALIARQENNFNPYLRDGKVPMKTDSKQWIKKFSNGIEFNTDAKVVYTSPYINYVPEV